MNNNLRQAVKLLILGVASLGVVAVVWAINSTAGLVVALIVGGLWSAYFADIERKKAKDKAAAQQKAWFLETVEATLPQIGADIMRGLLSEFGLPNNSQLPKLSYTQDNDGATVYTLRFAKLPRKDRLQPETLAGMVAVLNSAAVTCLMHNAYKNPFSKAYVRHNGCDFPRVYITQVQDNGREIVVHVLLAYSIADGQAMLCAYNANHSGNTNNAPPPQPTDTNDTDF
jgi:hypothetical protein